MHLIFTKMLKSKILLVNWATLIGTTATLWVNSDALVEHPQITAALASVLAGINVVLRYLTDKPLDEK